VEDARRVLEERARALARPPAPPLAQHTVELLTFALASETYALESRFVIQVFRLQELSPLPGAQPPVFGLTPWRGGLLTILDLRQVLGVPATSLDDLGRVIVLGDERPAFGVLADAVHDLVSVPAAAIRAPQEGVAARREYLRGVTGDAVLVLAAEALLRSHLSNRQGD
jgi:purine-binding chemotaxis protein CheW